jgi:transposase
MSDLVKAGDTPRGDRPRRIWSADEKRQIVAESFQPNASVAVVARRHGVNANLLFTWRRRLGRSGSVRRQEPVEIMPVAIATENAPAVLTAPLVKDGRIEIVLSAGERIIVGTDVEAAALARVIKVLSRR